MKVKRFIGTCSVLVLAALFASLLIVKSTSAVLKYEKSSDIQFTFDPILSLTLTGATTACGVTSGNPSYCITNLAPGNTDTSNTVNAKVASNNAAGWTLYATVGGTSKEVPATVSYSTTDLELSGGTGSSDSFTMIAAGTTALTNPGDWGFTIDNGTTYMDLPLYTTTTPKVINQTIDAAGTPATGYIGDTSGTGTDTQIGAHAKAAQIAGTYANVINFTATTNIPARQVTVVAGTDVASVSLDGSITTLTKSFAEGETVPITATCTSGNNFAGWNVSPEFGTFANRDNASTNFTVGANDVTITATCGHHIFPTTMQAFTSADAAAMNAGDTLTLEDTRDHQTYTVAKFADGDVWMIDNLKFGYDASNPDTTTLTLSPDTSDVAQTRTITAYDLVTYGNAAGEICTYASSETSGIGFDNSCMHSQHSAGSGTPIEGVWYNYAAATAGTITGYNNSTTATESVCPKGWTLPTYTQIDNLVTTIGSSPTTFNPVYGGYFFIGSIWDGASYGAWWSSSVRANIYRDILKYESNELVYDFDNRTYGVFVRCVSR